MRQVGQLPRIKVLCVYWHHLCIRGCGTQRDDLSKIIIQFCLTLKEETKRWMSVELHLSNSIFFFGPTAASGGLNHLMRLPVRETFIEFCHRESFKTYMHCPSCLALWRQMSVDVEFKTFIWYVKFGLKLVSWKFLLKIFPLLV